MILEAGNLAYTQMMYVDYHMFRALSLIRKWYMSCMSPSILLTPLEERQDCPDVGYTRTNPKTLYLLGT